MTESTVARANRAGQPCPPWCATDHHREITPGTYLSSHAGPSTDIGGFRGHPHDMISAVAVQFPSSGRQEVLIRGYRSGREDPDPSTYIRPDEAEGLAGLVEQLAGATPAQHRALAAAIRAAAAMIEKAANA